MANNEDQEYVVDFNDCISSIAIMFGHHPDTLWNHPRNNELRDLRKDPNVLLQGDRVFIPALRLKDESCATEQKHRFRRKGVPGKFEVQIEFNGEPRANIPYTLVVDGISIEGETDGEGWVREFIDPEAMFASLTLRPSGKPPEVIEFHLGYLNPVDTVLGQKERLRNLGFYNGPIDDALSDIFIESVRAFQKKHSLTVNGRVDDATKSKLKSEHRS